MERAAAEFAKGVGDWTEEGGNWAGSAKKMLFRRNEPKILLNLKELAFPGAKNELLLERRKPQSKPKNGHKSTLCTPVPCLLVSPGEMNRRMDRGSKRTGMRPLRYGCAGLILACCCLVLLFAESSFAASEPIQYLLDLREPTSHLAKVVMTVAGASPSTELQFPAWNNLYQIRDFARNIQELAADCDGAQEQLTRVDLNTWRSEAKPCAKLALRYAVYVAGSPPFSSALDSQHAFLNFATLLFYLPKERGRAAHVKLLIPAEWKVASLLEEDGDGFLAPNYERPGGQPGGGRAIPGIQLFSGWSNLSRGRSRGCQGLFSGPPAGLAAEDHRHRNRAHARRALFSLHVYPSFPA